MKPLLKYSGQDCPATNLLGSMGRAGGIQGSQWAWKDGGKGGKDWRYFAQDEAGKSNHPLIAAPRRVCYWVFGFSPAHRPWLMDPMGLKMLPGCPWSQGRPGTPCPVRSSLQPSDPTSR